MPYEEPEAKRKRLAVQDGGHYGFRTCGGCRRENQPMRKKEGAECVVCDAYWTWVLRFVEKLQRAKTKKDRLQIINATEESFKEWYEGEFSAFLRMREENGGRTPRAVKQEACTFQGVVNEGTEYDTIFVPEQTYYDDIDPSPAPGVIHDTRPGSTYISFFKACVS